MSTPSVSPPQAAQNYLVPSSGGTHAIPISGVFAGQPFIIDWRQFNTDQFAFQPQGVFVDNSQGTGTLTIAVNPPGVPGGVPVLGWNISVPAGAQLSTQFPAPNGQIWSITGLGQATIIAVDFPVLPNGNAVTVLGTANVNIVSPNPLPVQPTVNVAGAPYQTKENPNTVINDTAIVACPNAAATAICVVNAARKAISFTIDPNSAAASGTLFFRVHAGANNLLPAAPGITYPFTNTAAMDLQNTSGASVNVYVFEEQ